MNRPVSPQTVTRFLPAEQATNEAPVAEREAAMRARIRAEVEKQFFSDIAAQKAAVEESCEAVAKEAGYAL